MKTCIECKQEFPKTLEYFSKKGKYLRSYCKNCANAINKSWKKINAKKVKANDKAYRIANPEKVSAAIKTWQKANPEKVNAATKAWQKRNLDKVNALSRKRRARKLGNGFEPYTLEEIFKTYGTNCYLCDMPINYEAPRQVGKPGWRSGLHIEHFIDIALGGSDTIENVRPSHGWCNLTKGSN